MSVDQVLAHLNVAYDLTFTPEKFPKPNLLLNFSFEICKNRKSPTKFHYKQSLPTSPAFIIVDERNFEEEKAKLIGNIQRVQQLGREAFEGKENINFGK